MSDDILRRQTEDDASNRFQYDAIDKVRQLRTRLVTAEETAESALAAAAAAQETADAAIEPEAAAARSDPFLRSTVARQGPGTFALRRKPPRNRVRTVSVPAAGETSLGGIRGAIVIGASVPAQTYVVIDGDGVRVGSNVAAEVSVWVLD